MTVPLNPLEAFLDRVGRAALPYLTPQTCALTGLGVFVFFCFVKYRQDKKLPSGDDCLRVALTTVTLLTALVAILGLLLPTPPAPPEMNPGVLRALGLAATVSLSSYAGKIIVSLFSRKKPAVEV